MALRSLKKKSDFLRKEDLVNKEIFGIPIDMQQNKFGREELLIDGSVDDCGGIYSIPINANNESRLRDFFGPEWEHLDKTATYSFSFQPNGQKAEMNGNVYNLYDIVIKKVK